MKAALDLFQGLRACRLLASLDSSDYLAALVPGGRHPNSVQHMQLCCWRQLQNDKLGGARNPKLLEAHPKPCTLNFPKNLNPKPYSSFFGLTP